MFRVRAGTSFIAIALPGRESAHRDPCLTTVHDMAAFVERQIDRLDLNDIVLFGHSLGALVAYEAARRLERTATTTLRKLVVSGCASPTAPSSLRLSRLPDDVDFLNAVGELGGLSGEAGLDPSIVCYVLPILRADIAAADAYVYEPGRVRSPLLVLGGDNDPLVPRSSLEAWSDVAGAECAVQVMTGGHFFIFEHVDRILRLLRS